MAGIDKRAEHKEDHQYKELSPEQEQHIRRQLFYFTPFVRLLYQAMNQEQENEEKVFNPSVLDAIKKMTLYYAYVALTGEFDTNREQDLIEEIYNTLHMTPKEVQSKLARVGERTFNKSDGYISDYMFGSADVINVDSLDLPKAPHFDQGASEGLMAFTQRERNDFVQRFSEYIAQNRNDLPLSIFGNVARGIMDGAIIYMALVLHNIPCSYHLYRVSSHSMADNESRLLYENVDQLSWGICADSFTAKGASVPLSVELLSSLGFAKSSMYLTFFGELWEKELQKEFVWKFGDVAMLLQADHEKTKRYIQI